MATALCSGHGAISSSHHNFAYRATSGAMEPEFGLTLSNIPTNLVQKLVVSWRCMNPRRTCLGRNRCVLGLCLRRCMFLPCCLLISGLQRRRYSQSPWRWAACHRSRRGLHCGRGIAWGRVRSLRDFGRCFVLPWLVSVYYDAGSSIRHCYFMSRVSLWSYSRATRGSNRAKSNKSCDRCASTYLKLHIFTVTSTWSANLNRRLSLAEVTGNSPLRPLTMHLTLCRADILGLRSSLPDRKTCLSGSIH